MAWLSPAEGLFYWTVAARGIADARAERPREEDKQLLADEADNSAVAGNPAQSGAGCIVVSPYEAMVIKAAEVEIDEYLERYWRQEKEKFEGPAHKALHELEEELQRFHRNDENHRRRYPDMREPDRMFPLWIYLVGMTLVGVAEYYINLRAFEIMNLDPAETRIAALGPAVGIPVLAHILGVAARQWFDSEPRRAIVISGIVAGLLLMAVLGVTYLRALVAALNPETLLPGPVEYRVAIPAGLINLLFLALAFMGAYVAHDKDRELERLVRERRKIRRNVTKKWNAWNKLADTHDRLLKRAIARIDSVRSDAVARIMEYRAYNKRYRNTAPPAWFDAAVDEQRLFRQRSLGTELAHSPVTINELLERIVDEARAKTVTVE